MQLLFAQLLSLVSLTTPMTSCTRTPSSDAPGGSSVYTVNDTRSGDRDSINQTISGTRRNAITTAVAKASPAIVGINVTEVVERNVNPFFTGDPFFDQFFNQFNNGRGNTQRFQVKGLGSGFIISADGYILTNDHVAGNASKIIVTMTDGKQYDAKLVGTDRTSDVALLKIEGKNLPYLRLGNSDDIAVGEWAIALGNPFGLFDINDKPTVTVGVVSNTGVNLGLQEGGRNYRSMIQTDAAISSGNSGGPLLSATGEVIGINAVIRSTAMNGQGEAGSIGLGFAIPINKVKTVVDRLRNGTTVNHNFSDPGFHVADLTDEVRNYFKITTTAGVVVTDLRRGSAAERAGLEPGDVITGADNERVRRPEELESVLAEHQVNDIVTLHVQRDGKATDVRLKLEGK